MARGPGLRLVTHRAGLRNNASEPRDRDDGTGFHEGFPHGEVPDCLERGGDREVKGLLGPAPVRFLGHTKQVRVAGEGLFGGNNRILGSIRTGYYRAGIGPSRLGPNLRVINIGYDQPDNPRLMRGLTDEVRFVAENRLLRRGVHVAPGTSKPRVIFRFTVER